MKKIFALLIVATTLFSCSKTESPIFDGQRRITYFATSSAALQVVLDEGGTVSRNVVSSELSDVDRTVEIELVSNTLTDEAGNPVVNFTFTETVVIPAGEYFGTFTVTAESVEELTTSNELLVFRIASASDGSDLNGSLQQMEISMRLICPVPADYFVGSYLMEQISEQENPFFGGNGRSLSTQVVEVELEEGSTTGRTFAFSYFAAAFNAPYTAMIDLSCGDVLFEGTRDAGGTLGCGDGSIGIGTPETPSNFVVADGDDVVIFDVLDFAEDGGCGTTPFIATLRFTKQ